MYVRVSLKIELDISSSLSEIEGQIQQAGREGMKEALKQAIGQKTCPAFGSERVLPQGTKRRVLLTLFGRVEVPLRRISPLPIPGSPSRGTRLHDNQGGHQRAGSNAGRCPRPTVRELLPQGLAHS
jgi:hypothetical protein